MLDARTLFGVVVRAFGLVLIWNGVYDGFWAVMERSGVQLSAQWPDSTHAIFAAFYLIAGLVTIRGASLLVDFCYGTAATIDRRLEAGE